MSEEPRKRSRFDQTEPEPARKSRFDRRSRSPARNDTEPQRSRSPVTKSIERPGSAGRPDAAAAAAAAAAKINASISAKKGVQHVDVPPIQSISSPGASAGAAKSPSLPTPSGTLNDEIYQQDGDYIRDIEVNDLRNRYTLTKGSTQKMIKEKTGADVTTRGNYYPDKTMASPANPPLYLHVTSQTKEGLEGAVKEIDELMKQELPNLIDERRFRRREPEPQVERDSLGRRKWPEERIPIDLEPIPGFNLRAQVVGAGGSFVKHIQQETRCRVQIKGRGSGFMEHDTGHESDEQMYLHVAGPDANEVQNAKNMCISLLEAVRGAYEEFKERGPRGGQGSRGGYGEDGGQRRYHDRGDRNGSGSYGGQGGNGQYAGGGGGGGYAQQQVQTPVGYGAGYAQSPTTATEQQPFKTPEQQQAEIEAWSAYYDANPGEDKYLQWGGYRYIMQMYAAQGSLPYQQQQQGGGQLQQQGGYAQSPTQQQQQNGGMAAQAPPPPPPPEDQAQAQPPPPPGASGVGYNSVPPPPGM